MLRRIAENMRFLIIYPPFAPATAMPYSPAALKAALEQNLDITVQCLDLNALFHRLQFSQFYEEVKKTNNIQSYGLLLQQFATSARAMATENNKRVVAQQKPGLFSELLQQILDQKPDMIGFSLVYSSQCFYAKMLIEALEAKNIRCSIGGPSVNEKLQKAYTYLRNEQEMVTYINQITENKHQKKESKQKMLADFSDFQEENYFSNARILPIKTCTTCFYKQCTFCTHFAQIPYKEYNIEMIKATIIKNNAKKIFFIDDMIATPRLLELAAMLKPLHVTWWCQLRPTKDLLGKLQILSDAGLRAISWGVESGNQRVVDLMKKGTSIADVTAVLQESSKVKIKNIVYILFGFPTETKEEFLDTINFLKENSKNIDLVSTSTFGLQQGSKIMVAPEQFGVIQIKEEKRTILDEKITYRVATGLQNEEAKKLKKSYNKTIKNIDKMPRQIAYFKEQVLAFL